MNDIFYINFNDREISCPKLAEVNGKLVSGFYEIKENDAVIIRKYYTLSQIMEMLDLPYHTGILVNNMPAKKNTEIYDKFTILDKNITDTKNLVSSYLKVGGAVANEATDMADDENEADNEEIPEITEVTESKKTDSRSFREISVHVNRTPVTLKGKVHYVMVDVLDFYKFDMSEYKGKLIIEINGEGEKDFSSPVHEGDMIRLEWGE